MDKKLKQIQQFLHPSFYTGEIDGLIGPLSRKAISKYQKSLYLPSTGEVDEMTEYAIRLGLKFDNSLKLSSPDPSKGCKGNYFAEETDKTSIVYHHTAGRTVTKSGTNNTGFFWGWEEAIGTRIATHFSIGIDGKIYCHFNPSFWAHHLGIPGNGPRNVRMNKASVSIELVNEGAVWKKDNRWKFWAGTLRRNISPVRKSWREYEYWANYSQEQIESLKILTLFYSKLYDIPLNFVDTTLELDENVLSEKFDGVYSHSNVRKDKVDVSPAFPWEEFKEDVKTFKVPQLKEDVSDSLVGSEKKAKRSKDMKVKDALEEIKVQRIEGKDLTEFLKDEKRKSLTKLLNQKR